MRPRRRAEGRALVGVLVALLALAAWARHAGATVTVERGEEGWRVAAHGARLEDVLDAIAAEEGFEVEMQLGVERPPVDVDVSEAPLDKVLRRVLRRRNYAISYEETDDGLAVSRVTVLLPQADAQADGRSRPAAPGATKAGRPTVQTAQQRWAALRAAEVARIRAQAQREAQQRQQRLQQHRREQARRLAERRQAVRREAARQAAAEQVPLRRALWARGR